MWSKLTHFMYDFECDQKMVKLESTLTTYKWCPNVVETDSFYVIFRVWPKDGQIRVKINYLKVVPKCGQNWLILCKILSVTRRWWNWS